MVRVRVPATTANLGPGFDVLGMALNLYNYVEMEEIDSGLEISVEGEGSGKIPTCKDNIVCFIAQKVFEKVGYVPRGLGIRLVNRIPIARGLGSSAAALVGGAVAANALSGGRLTTAELVNIVSEVEGHSDNVVPAMVGGFTICARKEGEVIFRRIEPPKGLKVVVAVPHFELSTSAARHVLPRRVSLGDAVFNLGRACLLVYAVQAGDLDLLGQVMQDRLHQPYRLSLIPGIEDVFAAAMEAGSTGVALSGAGPAVIAFITGDREAGRVKGAMKESFLRHNVDCTVRALRPEKSGAVILDDNGGKG